MLTGASKSAAGSNLEALISALETDYKLMRTEIGRLIDHQRDLDNLSFISLAAVLAFIGALVKGEASKSLLVVLLLVPLLTLQFALTASDLARRIRQLGQYLHEVTSTTNEILEPELLEHLPKGSVQKHVFWAWETWKGSDFKEKSSWRRWQTLVLEKSRWLSLTFPGITAVVAYWVLDKKPLSNGLERWLFGVAIVALLFSAISLVAYRSEARGVS